MVEDLAGVQAVTCLLTVSNGDGGVDVPASGRRRRLSSCAAAWWAASAATPCFGPLPPRGLPNHATRVSSHCPAPGAAH